MIGYKLDKIKNDALSIVDKYYPKVQCVMLTGSQIEPEFLFLQSDMDIVLIDDSFSGVSSDGVKDGEYKVDFTRLSYSNLVNLLLENSYSMNPVILYMLKDGLLLKDDTGIGLLAQNYLKKMSL